jgi:hypothetical protein
MLLERQRSTPNSLLHPICPSRQICGGEVSEGHRIDISAEERAGQGDKKLCRFLSLEAGQSSSPENEHDGDRKVQNKKTGGIDARGDRNRLHRQ